MTEDVFSVKEPNSRRGLDAESIKLGFAAHLKYSLARDRYTSTLSDRYIALALAIRDRLVERWIETQQAHHDAKVKRVYYLSLEFLVGRLMGNNVINLGIENTVTEALADLGIDWNELREVEVDAGLGNGGLGRLAACFLDSLATLQIPAFGYGLRYDYGIFRQRIENGYQIEEPDDWLRLGNPWEIARTDYSVPVRLGGRVEKADVGGKTVSRWVDARLVMGVPYDTPVVGYGGNSVNNLRLWSARAAEEFDLQDFNKGNYIAAVESKVAAENLTKVLYPNDNVTAGKELRLRQQYFFVACSLADIIRRAKRDGDTLDDLPRLAGIQLNDTHPALAVPELMRLLIDEEGFEWDHAWDITRRTISYTNHTLLPEALEKWPVEMIERILPRHIEIIYHLNDLFLKEVLENYPGDVARMRRMSIIEEGHVRQVRMAYMSIVGSHSVNGVARIHTDLLKARVVPDFAEMFPHRFNSKTNGITQRRWLLKANPPLAELITEAIGDEWITDLDQLRRLAPLADDVSFREGFRRVKRAAKASLADHAKAAYGFVIDPDSIFDVHVKRLHEYKRQLLNALHVAVLYNRIRKDPDVSMTPRTFIFAGKAAPGYHIAKIIIKLINNLGAVIDRDPAVKGRIKVCFLPNYRVSLAERIIPAADVSEQISTAGTEASGTGNMKFMLNGALTLGTLDGANIEIMEEVGRENMFIFGLDAQQVLDLAPHYSPWEHYEKNAEIREALDFLFSPGFAGDAPGVFDVLRCVLLDWGDRYMHLVDLPDYARAQAEAESRYRDREDWARRAILNISAAGRFSSDRTIMEYAREIWDVEPFLMDNRKRMANTLFMARVLPDGATDLPLGQ